MRRIRFAALGILVLASLAQAQPTLVSTVPAVGATGVSPGAAVVFKFSAAMNTSLTEATFMDITAFPPATFTTVPTWSADAKQLTCTPNPAFPANKMIVWSVDGESAAGDALDTAGGMFTTGTGSGGSGGDCTNVFNSFTVAKGAFYEQTSNATPALSTNSPYAVVLCTTLACSNSGVASVSVRVPTGSTKTIPATTIPGHNSFTEIRTSLADMDTAYPNGDYVFNLQSGATVLPFTVNFPASLSMPNAPRLTNYAAAQAIDATQPFVLAWDAFQGGTAADWILVQIYSVFSSGDFGSPAALNGTARGITIPANTLKPASNYLASVTFYDMLCLTNGATGNVTLAYRSASTEFTLTTLSGASATPIVLTNAVRSANSFSFDVTAASGRTLIVESRTNLALGQWETVLTTNTPAGGRVHIADPRAATNRNLFYRAR